MDDIESQWQVADYCKAWRYQNKGFVAVGSVLDMLGQQFIVVAMMHWRYTDRKKPALSLVWESHCAICNQPYQFNKPRHTFTSLVRTCPAHRGQFRTPRIILPPLPRDPPRSNGRPATLQAAISLELEAIGLVYASLPLSALASLLAPLAAHRDGQRDTRRQRCQKALQSMARKGLVAIDNQHVVFS